MHKTNDEEMIKSMAVKHGLHDIFHPVVIDGMELQVYADKETVCRVGDKLDGLFVLVSGKLKIYTLLPNGKTVLLRFANPPALIGDVECLAEYPVKNVVEAVGESSLLAVSGELIRKELNNPAFLRFMVGHLSHKLYTLGHATAMNLLNPVENRFASYLLSLLPEKNGGEYIEEIRTSTLTETAELLGTSYRHLNRVINRLVKEGTLGRKNGRLLVLNERRLKELANNQFYT